MWQHVCISKKGNEFKITADINCESSKRRVRISERLWKKIFIKKYKPKLNNLSLSNNKTT